MKKFESPDLEIIKFTVADVITTSGDDEGDNEFPMYPASI